MSPILKKRISTASVAFLVALAAGSAAYADDSEIFVGTGSNVAPNVLLILDTSSSMTGEITQPGPYDPTTTYDNDGSCTSDKIYFVASGNTTAPRSCSGLLSVSSSSFHCAAAGGVKTVGYYPDTFIQWQSIKTTTTTTSHGHTTTTTTIKYSWAPDIAASGGNNTRYDVACKADWPSNGPTGILGSSTKAYPTNYNNTTDNDTNQWVSDPNSTLSYWKGLGTGTPYTAYMGNYINYIAGGQVNEIGTRMSVMKAAATNLASTLSNVNIGLMRYNSAGHGTGYDNAWGGMVIQPVLPIDDGTNRADLITKISSLSANGYTPLSETLFEAYRYLSGGAVLFGLNSSPQASATGSRQTDQSKYKSPITYQCQKSYIVYLTDGLPTEDTEANSLITGLGTTCDDVTKPPYNGKEYDNTTDLADPWGSIGRTGNKDAGRCMAALAGYMANPDNDINTNVAEKQHAYLYTIGFGADASLAAPSQWLTNAAIAGGGKFNSAGDQSALEAVFNNIFNDIKQTGTTFTAPTVSVNAFNRTQTLNDLYVSLFKPSLRWHWPGNVKKYQVKGSDIYDNSPTPKVAVDSSTGFFKTGTKSFWDNSGASDGPEVTLGGAAAMLGNWDEDAADARKIYTYIGANNPTSMVDLVNGGNNTAFTTKNTLITNALISAASDDDRKLFIKYARGMDPGTTLQNHNMGDPVHSQPAVVIYGGTTTTPNVNDAILFAATNDGFLHAIDADTGKEKWAFIPQELIKDMPKLYNNAPQSPKHYSLDGSIRVLKYDTNNDGIVNPSDNDRVILFFGQARGGSRYYAIDVTDKTTPKFMWSINTSTSGFGSMGQTWSTPAITRVIAKDTVQNSQNLVLIFGGGYDSAEETVDYRDSDSRGSAIYMVDALYGTLLWSVNGSDTNFARMDHAIPSDVTVLDLDGDGFADRMYVGDMAAQLWRFDIYSGKSPTGTGTDALVTGGVIASLGTHDDTSSHAKAATRRFYNAPDVAAIRKKGIPPFFNIAIGSGYRGHPLNTDVQDRFYSIRDYQPFDKLSQDDYKDYKIIHDGDDDLIDVSANVGNGTVPSTTDMVETTDRGWKVLLNMPGENWVGEKILASSTTINGQIMVPSYTPNNTTTADCSPGLGSNRLYTLDVFDGTGSYSKLSQGGIAPQVVVLFPEEPKKEVPDPNAPPPDPNAPPPPPPPPYSPVVCLSGAEVLGACKKFDTLFKTYWTESDAK